MHSILRYLKGLCRGKQKAIFTSHSLVKALQAIMVPVNAIYSKHCLAKKYMGNRNPPSASHLSLSQIQATVPPNRRKGSEGKKLIDSTARMGEQLLGHRCHMGSSAARDGELSGPRPRRWLCAPVEGLDVLWRDICCSERQNITQENEGMMGLKNP